MDWRLWDDPTNIENRNAGNGGDIVKHTVYLAALRFLLQQEPWKHGLNLRECHAGRGIYQIPNDDARIRLLSCLYSSPVIDRTVFLQDVQRDLLGALGCWPCPVEGSWLYAGSALTNAWILSKQQPGAHSLDLYNGSLTRGESCGLCLTGIQLDEHLHVNVPPTGESGETFDGEAYIEQQIGTWGKRDVVLLDPFAMWRQAADQPRRDRYGAIFEALIRHGTDAPSLILFWTWGRAFPVADGDLDGTARPVRNGYATLRAKLHKLDSISCWPSGVGAFSSQCGSWCRRSISQHSETEIDKHCHQLSEHLIRQGCGENLSHPTVEVAID